MNSEKALPGNFSGIKDHIKAVCQQCGRDVQAIQLIAASKTQPVEKIMELHQLGQKFFGENYAQEMEEKAQFLPGSVEWIFIGRVQSNKIKRIVRIASEIQTLTSLKHAVVIARTAEELGKVPFSVFIEINLGEESNKAGLSFEDAWDFQEELKRIPQLKLRGLMAIPPLRYVTNWDKEGEDLYRTLRSKAYEFGEGKLSLGMSGDYKQAIRCGSDIVRVGSSLFGPRT